MKVKMNEKVISILPYLSTTWSNIQLLYLGKDSVLVFSLVDGTKVEVPGLTEATINAIFDMHVKVSETHESGGASNNVVVPAEVVMPEKQAAGFNLPLGMDLSGMENFGAMMQHNPEQSNSPDLPPEVLQKVAGIAKVMGDTEMGSVPQPEQGCNCFYCQIVRAIHQGVGDLVDAEGEEEEISDDELKFREWDIKQIGDNLYEVSNPLDSIEKYNVFLGKPLGCTCGEKNCEHIKAVLES
jgi:hypothetical protein